MWPALLEPLKKALSLGAVALLAWLGETSQDGGFIRDVWTAAKQASPLAAMFAILAWLDERRERREAQRQCNERTIDFVKATNEASAAFKETLGKLAEKVAELQPMRRRR